MMYKITSLQILPSDVLDSMKIYENGFVSVIWSICFIFVLFVGWRIQKYAWDN